MLSICTFAQKPEVRDQIDQLSDEVWPRFLMHGNIYHWHLLFELFPDYQLLFCDSANRVVAVGHTVPFSWDGSLADLPQTIEEIVLRAEQVSRQQQAPNTLSALAAMVSGDYRRQNLSGQIIQEMKAVARQKACMTLIAPVRPTWKSRYPLTPMERYVGWRREDGAPFDPWIRTHWRAGAQAISIAPNTLTVEGTLAEWESWTGMVFPDSGWYIVPGALQPVQMDCENNRGRYEEPNYWMQHIVA